MPEVRLDGRKCVDVAQFLDRLDEDQDCVAGVEQDALL
jgi:hypothetical protein